jgi:uncharacterized protein (DUF486 family)
VVLVSWAIALFEYCLAVSANRLGYAYFSGFQLKIIELMGVETFGAVVKIQRQVIEPTYKNGRMLDYL